MGEFLKGWRRKLGVLTLMMACAFTVECLRRTQMDWEMICPADWEHVRMYSIAPLLVVSYRLFGKPPPPEST